ncbi:MAG: oligosaccharide flippase family protein, partial [Moorellaceae bacterium]
IARTKLNQSLGQVITQLGLGLMRLGPLGLLSGQLVGQVLGSTTLATMAWRNDRCLLKAISLVDVRWAAKRYWRFPIFSSSSSLLNNAGLQLPAILLAAFYGPQVAGWFALGQRVLGMPMTLIGDAVAQVYLGEAPRLSRDNPQALRQLFMRTMFRLLLMGGIPVVSIASGGPWLFALLFGEGWRETGFYVRLLGAMFLIRFIVAPLSQTLNILERQDLQLMWDVTRLIITVVSLFLPYTLGWLHIQAILTYSITMFVAYLGLFVLLNHILTYSVKSFEKVGRKL